MKRDDARADVQRLSLTVSDNDVGTRLDKWLSDAAAGVTRTRIKVLIDSGAISKSGQTFTDRSWKVRAGETYELAVPVLETASPQGEPIALDVRHEDDDIIVVNKPAGLVVHPSPGNWTGTLVNALIAHCGESLSGIGGVARPGIVHRLDKDTSGLLVAAKNDAAHQKLSAAFSVHDVERAYSAIVHGCPRPAVGLIDAALARASDRVKMTVVAKNNQRPDQRVAITHYRVMEIFGRSRAKIAGDALASLIDCTLETGRTHQIRVHLASIGHPLVGDPVYGRGPGLSGLKPGEPVSDHAFAVVSKFRRQALHARILGFDHPRSGARLRFEAEPPSDFSELWEALAAL
ncbi:MAG: RluA family pseudouridine synthase [Parvularculaceae bacterium]|nr:RluA family pseudouridine synthase [Parvularculaceae bacterium]